MASAAAVGRGCGVVIRMWKLHRYYLREVATSALLTFTVLFGIVLLSSVSRGIKRAEGFSLLTAAKITFYWTVDTLPHLLPIALLFATVLTFARASQDREVTAIRAAGISPRTAVTAPLLVGILLSLIAGWALHWVVPHVHYSKFRVAADTIREVLLTTGMTGDQFRFKGLVMSWESEDAEGHWHEVVIHVRGDREEFQALGQGVFLADEAWVEVVDDERLTLFLKDPRDAAGRYQPPELLRISVNIRAISEGNRRDESNKDLTSDQLLAEVYRGIHPRPNAARYLVHQRMCFALLPALLAPIGFCIGVMSQARGRTLALVFAIVPLFVFYLSDVFGARLVRAFDQPLFAWTPAAVLVLLGLPFCWRLLRY